MVLWNTDDKTWKKWSVNLFVVICFLFILCQRAYSFRGAFLLNDYKAPALLGILQSYTIKDDRETLVDLAIQYDLGYNEITDANPGVDPWYPGKGTRVIIPTIWITPELKDLQADTIVINLAELRLYYFKILTTGKVAVLTFPIGIGSEGRDTPLGTYRIIQKIKDPVWVVPPSIRAEEPTLPEMVPPGPDNPLGRYALRLSNPSYLIHGTNKPLGIGRRVSHGCLRMYPEDIKTLYDLVRVGTEVKIIYEPIKLLFSSDGVYIEAHADYRTGGTDLTRAVRKLISSGTLQRIDTKELYRILQRHDGIPHLLKFK